MIADLAATSYLHVSQCHSNGIVDMWHVVSSSITVARAISVVVNIMPVRVARSNSRWDLTKHVSYVPLEISNTMKGKLIVTA